MKTLRWTKKKPQFKPRSKECLLLVATKFNKGWEYHLYHIKKTGFNEEGWYWGVFTNEGDEWGDYSDLMAERYAIIKPL